VKQLMAEHGTELLKGAVGTMAALLSVLTSFQENVEHMARVGALVGGMIVSALTAISIVRGWKKRRK
jgi:hypothetical protein